MIVLRRMVFACLACLLATASYGTEYNVQVPPGWRFASSVVSASGDRIALLLLPESTDAYVAGSKLVLLAPGSSQQIDFMGKVFHVTHSPSGSHLLVHHESSAGRRVTLVSTAQAQSLWTKDSSQLFSFSAEGGFVVARDVSSEMGHPGKQMVVYDLDGEKVNKVELDVPFAGGVVLGAGEKLVLAFRRRVVGYEVDEKIHERWAVDVPSGEAPIERMDWLEAERVLVRQQMGAFKVIRLSGAVDFSYNPQALAAADPGQTLEHFAAYKPSLGNAGELLLFDGSDRRSVDLATGSISSKPTAAAPPGYTLSGDSDGSTLIYQSPGSILIRRLQ